MRLLKVSLPTLFFLTPLIPLLFYFRYNWYSFFHLYSLSVAAGISGYTYFLNQFITGGRLKWLDRLYGYDRVLIFHRGMAIFGFICVVFHSRTKDLPEDLQVRLGAMALALFTLLIILALLFLSNALSHVSIFGRLRAWVQRRLRLQYQHFLLIHNLTAVAMLLALAHVLLATSTQESPYRFAVMLLWYCGATATYVWYKFIRPRKYKRHPFRVTQITHEAPQIVTLKLAAPEGGGFTYRPGQFCFMYFANGKMMRDEHPYTISSAPYRRDHITITVKDCGDWSGALRTRAAVGDRVVIDGGYGKFSHTLLPMGERTAPLIFVAGGVGVTPFISMLDALANEQSSRSILLLWKTRTKEELFLRRRITAWKRRLPNFRSTLFASESQSERITVSEICAALTDLELGSGHYFLCGPVRMVRSCRHYLRGQRVDRQRLHNENFGF